MSTIRLTEAALEQTALTWFESLDYQIQNSSKVSPGEPGSERKDFSDVVLKGRLHLALQNINPTIPEETIQDAIKHITHTYYSSPIDNNRSFHRMLTEGVNVSYLEDGRHKGDQVWLLDLDDLDNNDWLVINQFSITENRHTRRPDILIFVNGLPLAIIELKNPTDEKTTITHAYDQLQDYKKNIPSLFIYNQLLIVSDGLQARIGSLTAHWDRFMPWRTIDRLEPEPKSAIQLEVLIKGIFQKHRFLDLMLNFIAFDDDGQTISKKIAAYHQFHAVNKAVAFAFSACGYPYDPNQLNGRFPRFIDNTPDSVHAGYSPYTPAPDHFNHRQIGVIWHTQGSFKSMSMTFFAGKLIRHKGMKNPTMVIITDRNDLDNQLFATFSHCKDLLRQTPIQALNKDHLKGLLNTAGGGVIFTTIQKFQPDQKGSSYPQLSARLNIIVIADEAHRSQYDFIDGFARHLHDALPNASFIGFTGTPIESADINTQNVFGKYIDTYDILRAVEDGATVPIYYESRLAKIELLESERPKIDPEFEEITEGEEESSKLKLQSKWARMEAMVGTAKRIEKIGADIVNHFTQRNAVLDGKGLIVCMSRRICVDMYKTIVKINPQWHSRDINTGSIKIVMTGSIDDDPTWQPHIHSKLERENLAKRFKDPNDSLKLVIVRDMWLTGFDCPPLHTMYVDKPMRSHGLMQAIARVNRVYKDKPGGLVVDYIGLIEQLKEALAQYTQAGGTGQPSIDIDVAIDVLHKAYQNVVALLAGFDYLSILHVDPRHRLQGIAAAINFILSEVERKKQFLAAVTKLSQAFALCVPHEEALKLRDELGLFQELRAAIAKDSLNGTPATSEELDSAIQQLVSRAVTSDEVIDIFAVAGFKKPDISILSPSFLQEIRHFLYPNLAVELLQRLVAEDITEKFRKRPLQARSFAAMLEETIKRYQNHSLETVEVIEVLIEMAKNMNEAQRRGEETGLSADELAFYEALEINDSAVKVMGDEKLKLIAQELVTAVRKSITLDWTIRDSARAKIRLKVKAILRKYGYPPDKQEKATDTVLEQAEVLCNDWDNQEEKE